MRRSRHQESRRGPIRVAILDHTGALGGAELALLRLLGSIDPTAIHATTILFSEGPLPERLRITGHEVEVFCLREEIAGAGRESVGGSVGAAFLSALKVLPFAVRLGLHLREVRPDLIHTTSLKADLIGVPASWIAGRPLVWHIHDRISPDYLPRTMVWLIRILARHVPRHVIANSDATAATLPGVRNLIVAFPGFGRDQLGPSATERTIPEPPVVGILGRISPTKGQLEFVRAAARVLEVRPEVRFRVIGDALFSEHEYAEEVLRQVTHLGIGDSVEFTGFVTDPAAALDALTLFVHASPTPEPFGQVIVEAMIRGVPVIATRGGGVGEIVQPDPAAEPLGRLVSSHDAEELARAILEALDHPETTQQRAQAAWVSAQERFPIERTAAAISEVWQRVARGR